MDKNRKTAFDALLEIQTKKAYSNIAVNRAVTKNIPDDEAFVRNLVYGVLENQIFIDHRLSQLMKQKLKKVNPKALTLLRMGAYQLEFADSVPAYAAINESVNIAKKVCRGLDGFINGVLRSYERRNGDFEMPDKSAEPSRYLAVKYSYNEDIAEMWLNMYGFQKAESMMIAGNQAPPLTIRVNRLKTDAGALREMLEKRGFNVQAARTGSDGYDHVLDGLALNVSGSGLIASDLYKNGYFSVQDISSMLMVSALDPQPGDTLLDLCAAPGGKSMCAAEMMNDKGKVISCDIYEHKVELMEKAAERLGIKCLKAEKNDALEYNSRFEGIADCVIADVPCSGLGVVRRKPEIKLHTSLENIKELAEIQLKILDNAARYVKENGRLVYSTCTVSQYENENVTEMFLKKNNNFSVLKTVQLFPDNDNADGFYFTVMQRF